MQAENGLYPRQRTAFHHLGSAFGFLFGWLEHQSNRPLQLPLPLLQQYGCT
ncbi:hypothetical protein D3C71_2196570 [compost metagenome]